ncbi:hypothetical protein P9C96_000720 [Escherichia coli]|uniref:hypothetical protein n=1 Tax=Escherichia coli TaxID=562 RepID=UPI00092E2200|nr:hypothetical protein [Escherichia coli]EAA2973628.1 hypothetical protein [Escherichia coli]EGE3054905.1 hypothetical protein [Escherichia coli]EID8868688.1 hypothetical protein [Escherichia coli]EKR7586826.1 hypothetical protein [Escherichia coli]
MTQEIETELIATDYEFELLPVACTGRLRDVLKGMSYVELVLPPGEIPFQKRRAPSEKAIVSQIN